jgi:hypothetical protein
MDVFKSNTFIFIQTNCEDPAGTRLLYGGIIAFLVLGVLIFVMFVFKYVPFLPDSQPQSRPP